MALEQSSWDPLELGDGDIAVEVVTAAQKRQVGNILKSYVGFYDPFSEMLQNAMDAVDARERDLKEKTYKKKLYITVDLKENSFTVIDNGIGFEEVKFK